MKGKVCRAGTSGKKPCKTTGRQKKVFGGGGAHKGEGAKKKMGRGAQTFFPKVPQKWGGKNSRLKITQANLGKRQNQRNRRKRLSKRKKKLIW